MVSACMAPSNTTNCTRAVIFLKGLLQLLLVPFLLIGWCWAIAYGNKLREKSKKQEKAKIHQIELRPVSLEADSATVINNT